jgi:hypothetical protein
VAKTTASAPKGAEGSVILRQQAVNRAFQAVPVPAFRAVLYVNPGAMIRVQQDRGNLQFSLKAYKNSETSGRIATTICIIRSEEALYGNEG